VVLPRNADTIDFARRTHIEITFARTCRQLCRSVPLRTYSKVKTSAIGKTFAGGQPEPLPTSLRQTGLVKILFIRMIFVRMVLVRTIFVGNVPGGTIFGRAAFTGTVFVGTLLVSPILIRPIPRDGFS